MRTGRRHREMHPPAQRDQGGGRVWRRSNHAVGVVALKPPKRRQRASTWSSLRSDACGPVFEESVFVGVIDVGERWRGDEVRKGIFINGDFWLRRRGPTAGRGIGQRWPGDRRMVGEERHQRGLPLSAFTTGACTRHCTEMRSNLEEVEANDRWTTDGATV